MSVAEVPGEKKKADPGSCEKQNKTQHTHKWLRWLREGKVLQQDVPGMVDHI